MDLKTGQWVNRVKVNVGSYSGTKGELQARSASKEASVIRSANQRANRKRLLSYALPAMRRLYDNSLASKHQDERVACFIAATVELAHLSGELGVFDQDRVADIATFFDADLGSVDLQWFAAKQMIEANVASCSPAAHRRLDAGEVAVIAHRPIVDLKYAAEVYEKTPERDRRLFGKGKGRVHTGMPNINPPVEYIHVSLIPDGPGTDRFTTVERKAMAEEAGVKTETLRRKERDLSVEEFDAWLARRRKCMATKAARAAVKAMRAGRRRRRPGRTLAIRAYAERHGIKERQAFNRCRGLTEDEIRALGPGALVEQRRHAGPQDCSDTGSDIQAAAAREVSHSLSRCSDKCSDKDPGYTAFSHNSTPDTSVKGCNAETNVTPTFPQRKQRRHAKPLHECERQMLDAWHKAMKGKALTDALVRQWRSRKVLKAKLDAARDWLMASDDDYASELDAEVDQGSTLRIVESRAA